MILASTATQWHSLPETGHYELLMKMNYSAQLAKVLINLLANV
jgi:hypothetical protein